MVLTYREMVAALVNAGAIKADLIHTTNVEHLRYWAKIEPGANQTAFAMVIGVAVAGASVIAFVVYERWRIFEAELSEEAEAVACSRQFN